MTEKQPIFYWKGELQTIFRPSIAKNDHLGYSVNPYIMAPLIMWENNHMLVKFTEYEYHLLDHL